MKKENVVSLNAPKYVQQTYFTLRRPHHRTCTFRPWCVEPYDSFAALSYQIYLFYAERDCFFETVQSMEISIYNLKKKPTNYIIKMLI